MSPSASPSGEAEAILFRPAKKRKFYRQRATSLEHDSITSTSTSPPPAAVVGSKAITLDELVASSSPLTTSHTSVPGIEPEGTSVSIAEIIRLRKRNKKLGGVEFSSMLGNGKTLRDDDGPVAGQNISPGEIAQEEESARGGLTVRKFAPQTGMVGDVDKHMMAYIESEIAKRRLEQSAPSQMRNGLSSPPTATPSSRNPETKPGADLDRQPATLGKLQEIDLGAEARDRNVSLTEAARQRLHGEKAADETQPKKAPKKPRLGPDGKPWRVRKRRGSDDVRRDMVVEAVMRENRLEHYEAPAPPASVSTTGETGQDLAADDRIAEAFRREFMDSVASRRRKKPAPPAAAGPTGKKDEELKGPKLGGSRNARAAMRESMLKGTAKK